MTGVQTFSLPIFSYCGHEYELVEVKNRMIRSVMVSKIVDPVADGEDVQELS